MAEYTQGGVVKFQTEDGDKRVGKIIEEPGPGRNYYTIRAGPLWAIPEDDILDEVQENVE